MDVGFLQLAKQKGTSCWENSIKEEKAGFLEGKKHDQLLKRFYFLTLMEHPELGTDEATASEDLS